MPDAGGVASGHHSLHRVHLLISIITWLTNGHVELTVQAIAGDTGSVSRVLPPNAMVPSSCIQMCASARMRALPPLARADAAALP